MTAADDKKATGTVQTILGDGSINKIKFTIGKWTISPELYKKVDKAITAKEITVIVAPSALGNGVAGKYFSTLTIDKDNEWYDVLILGKPDLGQTLNEQFAAAQTVVHECTHAGLDILKLDKMTHLDHEAIAYAADAIFAVAKMLALKGNPNKVNITESIRKAAWDIGLLVVNQNKGIPKALLTALNAAISQDPNYKATASDIVKNDGVGHKWKIGGRLEK